MYSHPSFTRRRTLQSLAVLGLSAMSQAGQAQRPVARFAQVIDTSPSQQELSRDYSTGVRLAWAELGAARGPLAATPLVTLESDGSEASLQAVLARLREDASIAGLVGSVGDRLAVELVARTRAAGLQIPHIAPWMADSRHDADPSVFCLFPSRDVQLRHALGAVQGMGIDDVSVAFSSERDRAAYAGEIEALAKRLSLRVTLQAPAAGEDARALPARMKAQASGLVLFMGTSAELALLSQAMAALSCSTRSRRRSVSPATWRASMPARRCSAPAERTARAARRCSVNCANASRSSCAVFASTSAMAAAAAST